MMIHQNTSDLCIAAYSPKARLRLIHVDVTDSARALEQSHLSGPVAGLIQAEALTGVAILGSELTLPEETISFQMRLPHGQLGGLLVEAASDGALRGYTYTKILNELDASEEDDAVILDKALGPLAECRIIRSIPGKILSHAIFTLDNPTVTEAVEAYFDQSLQRQVICQLSATSTDGYLVRARGCMLDCLPDGDLNVFEKACEFFEDGSVQDLLDAGAAVTEIGNLLGLDDLQEDSPKPLTFRCRCSQERVEQVLLTLSDAELEEMAAKDIPTEIYCHMCGKGYQILPGRIKQVLDERRVPAPEGKPLKKSEPPDEKK